ncbi:LOW QUALITY PROTEIN: hypothetical protein V2J09_007321 [Rumex salicifolius]
MSSLFLLLVFFSLFLFFLFSTTGENGSSNSGCDVFQGKWVYEQQSSPPYNSSSCPFIRFEFDCQQNGRPDTSYLKFTWQPNGCDLPRLDAHEFLRRFRGKKIMFVGDSLMMNQWQSLTCLIHSAVPKAKYTLSQYPPVYLFHLPEYELSIMMQWHQFLVEIEEETKGRRILKLDYIKGDKWRGIDLLMGLHARGRIYKDMDRSVAFKLALEHWAKWIDQNMDPTKTKVFYQGISPSHYRGGEGGLPHSKGCAESREPIEGEGQDLPENPAVWVVKSVLSGMKHPSYFLDISHMSLLRPDAHPSIYGSKVHGLVPDCTHWCLAGLPDTWNHLLYHALLTNHTLSS